MLFLNHGTGFVKGWKEKGKILILFKIFGVLDIGFYWIIKNIKNDEKWTRRTGSYCGSMRLA